MSKKKWGFLFCGLLGRAEMPGECGGPRPVSHSIGPENYLRSELLVAHAQARLAQVKNIIGNPLIVARFTINVLLAFGHKVSDPFE